MVRFERKTQTLTPQERFAFNLRRARIAAGISQEELGERCDLHRTEISLLERAGREPRLGTILKLSGALRVDLTVLGDGISWDLGEQRYEVTPLPNG